MKWIVKLEDFHPSSCDHDGALSEGAACLTSVQWHHGHSALENHLPLWAYDIERRGRERGSGTVSSAGPARQTCTPKPPVNLSWYFQLQALCWTFIKFQLSEGKNTHRLWGPVQLGMCPCSLLTRATCVHFLFMPFVGGRWKTQTQGSNKSQRIGEKGWCLDECAWSCWPRQKPVQGEQRGLLFSFAQRWQWGHSGRHDPCDPHVTPLQLLQRSVRLLGCYASIREKKQEQDTLGSFSQENIFYWQHYKYVCIQILQIGKKKKKKLT